MSTKKDTEVATVADQSVMDQLKESFPSEPGAIRIQLPRIGMISQDKTEGKGKAMKVVAEAGTFQIERQTDEDEKDEEGNLTGRKVWEKLDIGTGFEGVILFKRRQLRMYDETTEKYTSSPIYDSDEESVPIFCEKSQVARGVPKDLKAKYMYTNKNGKNVSALEDNRILYIRHEGEIYQMNLRGSSMYSFMAYERKVVPNTVITEFSSEAMEKGDIAWNKMTFKAVRPLNSEEATIVLESVNSLKNAVAVEKASFAAVTEKDESKNKELNEMVEDAKEASEKKHAALPPKKSKF